METTPPRQKNTGWMYALEEHHRVWLLMTYATIAAVTNKTDARRQSLDKFKIEFPDVEWIPDEQTFGRKIDLIERKKSYDDRRKSIEHVKKARTPENVEIIKKRILTNHKDSLNKIAKSENLSRATVQRTFKEELNGFKWKLRKCNHLPPTSWPKRLNACQLFLKVMRENIRWLSRVWWSDEKHYTLDHTYNPRNDGYLAINGEIPDISELNVPKTAYPKKVTVLTAVNQIHGLISVCEWLDEKGNRINVDKNNYISAVDKITREIERRTGDDFKHQIWHQDGASCHNAKDTIAFIQEKFGDRYIATKPGPSGLFWPPYSCEMNVLDRNIWGIMEDRVNAREYNSPKVLEKIILDVSQEMDNDRELIARCVLQFPDVCQAIIDNEGRNINLSWWRRQQRINSSTVTPTD